MYAGFVTTTGGDVRWARGLAVALVTVPGVLLAQLLVTGTVPTLRSAVVVAAVTSVVVATVTCAVPTRTIAGTAGLAAVAQLAGHLVLALAAPQAHARQGCLSVVGHGADLGVRYALVHGDACPPGTLSAAPALTAVAAAVAGAALVLLGSALLAALTGVLVAALAAGLELVRRLVDAVLPALALLLGVQVVPTRRPTPPLPRPPALTGLWQPGRLARRGPPLVLAAV
jgi:hypothetical protein